MEEYIKQAQDFLNKTNTELKIVFLKHDIYFDDDHPRDIYQCTLTRGQRSYSFTFGQSIINSMKYKNTLTKEVFLCDGSSEKSYYKKVTQKYLKEFCKPLQVYVKVDGKAKHVIKRKEPNAYDILASMESYPIDDFQDFCDCFDYDTDSIKTLKVYRSCKEQYENLCMLFNDQELEELQEIQ